MSEIQYRREYLIALAAPERRIRDGEEVYCRRDWKG